MRGDGTGYGELTSVKTETEPNSMVLGPPETISSSLGERVCLQSLSSSELSGRGLNFLRKGRSASKSIVPGARISALLSYGT